MRVLSKGPIRGRYREAEETVHGLQGPFKKISKEFTFSSDSVGDLEYVLA